MYPHTVDKDILLMDVPIIYILNYMCTAADRALLR